MNDQKQMAGKASLRFQRPPVIAAAACVAGRKEGEGPLGPLYDQVDESDFFGADSWEKAESAMQKRAAQLALKKGNASPDQVRYLFAGDLLGQLIATSFGTMELGIPLFGLYGACSTMGEALCLGAMTVNAGYGDQVMAMTSSHFATAEKQFRFPLAYGNQRPLSATWTVTGCGSLLLTPWGSEGLARIPAVTVGRIEDLGIRDSMNMGAAMAPAAFHTIEQNFLDLGVDETWYDQIITGDLGMIGSRILLDLMKEKGRNLKGIHRDCGCLVYHNRRQDTHSGGSGCGCSALVLCAYILPKIRSGEWKRVLFVPTGALLSTVSFNEGQSIPGIAHGVVIEGMR